MKKRLLIPILLLCTALLSAQAVREATPSISTRSATDANGRTVVLEAPVTDLLIAAKAAVMPANALVLFPEVDDMHLSLAKTDQGLGDFFSLIKPEIDQQARLSQTASVEEIAARGADLVLLKATHYESTAKKLDQLGVKNFTMSLETWPEWQAESVSCSCRQTARTTPPATRSPPAVGCRPGWSRPVAPCRSGRAPIRRPRDGRR